VIYALTVHEFIRRRLRFKKVRVLITHGQSLGTGVHVWKVALATSIGTRKLIRKVYLPFISSDIHKKCRETVMRTLNSKNLKNPHVKNKTGHLWKMRELKTEWSTISISWINLA